VARRRALLAAAALLALVTVAYHGGPRALRAFQAPPGDGPAVACDDTPSPALRVYSSRDVDIVGPVSERFHRATGLSVELCYGSPPTLGRAIIAGDSNAPPDVYLGPNVVGLIASGRLRRLPDRILTRVDDEFRSTGGEWVGVTGRARIVVYNTDRVSADQLPDSILGFTDPVWQGRLGWAPTNGSFQDFVAALWVIVGAEGARDWLAGIQANQPVAYGPRGQENASILEAVAAGAVDAGFVNSSYLPELRPLDSTVRNVAGKYYTDGDPGAVIHVSIGAGVLNTTRNAPAAERFIEFLLENESQRAFAAVLELPLARGVVDPSDGLLFNLASLRQRQLNLTRLEAATGPSRALTAEVTGITLSGDGH
jgi:iron(III) transport system substrate-binding protein